MNWRHPLLLSAFAVLLAAIAVALGRRRVLSLELDDDVPVEEDAPAHLEDE